MLTNRVPTTVVRGAGRPQAVFAMERLMDRVARELKLDRAELRARNMIRPEQMPYSVGLIFRDGKPLVYASGDFPKSQRRAIALSDYVSFCERQAESVRRRAIYRHRHRQLRRGHRARAVRRCDRARPSQWQGRGRDRRHQPGTRHAHDLVASRGGRSRLRRRGHRDDRRRYRGDLARRRRLRQPPGDQCRLIRADGRQQRAPADHFARCPRAWRAGERHRGRGWPRDGARRQQAVDVARRAGARRARHARAFPFAPARRRGSRTPPISRRHRRRIATARMSRRSRSIRLPAA